MIYNVKSKTVYRLYLGKSVLFHELKLVAIIQKHGFIFIHYNGHYYCYFTQI